MEENKLSLFSKIKLSILDITAYPIFLKESGGRAILYLFLISILFGTLNGLNLLYDFNRGIDEMTQSFAVKAPEFTLQNGRLTVDEKMPYVIDKTEDVIFIVDTSGQTNASVLNNYSQGIFFSEQNMVIKQHEGETRNINYSVFQDTTVTKDVVINWLPKLKWITVLLILAGFIFYFIGKLFNALIVSLIGLIITASTKYKLSFGELYRLSIYALTLPMALQALASLLKLNIPYFIVIYHGIAVFYLYRVIKMLKENSQVE